jgi:hypothetical protein
MTMREGQSHSYRANLLRGITVALAMTIGAMMLLGQAQASIIQQWSSPYTAIGFSKSPVSVNTGTGFVHFCCGPNETLSSGVLTFEAQTYSAAPFGDHATNGLTVGFAQVGSHYMCVSPCTTGVHQVDFDYAITWNYTESSSCVGSSPSDLALTQLTVAGSVYDITSNSQTSGSTSIISISNSCPSSVTGGATNTAYGTSVRASFTSGDSYEFNTSIIADVQTSCPGLSGGNCNSGDWVNSELNMAVGGAEAKLASVVLST